MFFNIHQVQNKTEHSISQKEEEEEDGEREDDEDEVETAIKCNGGRGGRLSKWES